MSNGLTAVRALQPLQHAGYAGDFLPRRQKRAPYHQDRQAKRASGVQLGLRAAAPCVLAHHNVHPVLAQQGDVACHIEGAARDNGRVVWQRWQSVGLVDQAQDVMVLRLTREGGQMHPAHRQHHTLRRTAQRRCGARQIGHALPVVTVAWKPGVACKCQQRNPNLLAGSDGMATHTRSKGVSGVHHMSDFVTLQIVRQTWHTAEAADAHCNWLHTRLGHPTRIRQRGAVPPFGQNTGQRACFGRAAQDQDIAYD